MGKLLGIASTAEGAEIDPGAPWLQHGWGPVEAGVDLTIVRAAPGHVRFKATPPLTTDPDEDWAAGVLGVIADSGSAVTAFCGIGPYSTGPTVELRTDFVAPVPIGATALFAEGFLIRADEQLAGTRVEVTDDSGHLIAHVLGVHGIDQAAGEEGTSGPAFTQSFNPEDVRVERIDGVVLAPLTQGMLNGRGGLHGGPLAAIAHAAQREHHRHEGLEIRILHTSVEFIRPADLSGPITCRTQTVRSGRRFRSTKTELLRPDGRLAALATGSVAVLDSAGVRET